MSESFSVPEMRTHESSLKSVDATTQGIKQNAEQTGIGDWQMYGLFTSPLACGVLHLANMANTGTIRDLAGVTQAVATGFTNTTNLYEAMEKSNVDLAASIDRELDDMGNRSHR